MRLLIRRVEVHPIPARGKVDLGTNTLGAVNGWEGGTLGRPSAGVVEAHMRDGLLLEGLVVRAKLGVTSQHAKPRREGHQLLARIRHTLLIVDGATLNWDFGKSAVLGTIVHVRYPVVGEVALNGARGTSGLLRVVVVHLGSKGVASEDDVGVTRGNPRANDGVQTTGNKSASAGHAPVCVDRAGEGGQEAGGQGRGVGRKHDEVLLFEREA